MSSGFTVDIEELEEASSRVASAGERIRDVQVATAAGSVPAAVSGSRIAAATGSVAERLEAATAVLANDVEAIAESGKASARDYDAVDAETTAMLSGLVDELWGNGHAAG